MKRALAASLLALGIVAPSDGSSRAFYAYRDDHDGRILALASARLDGHDLTVEIRAYGPGVQPPLGFDGVVGENLHTAHEMESLLADGSLEAEVSERGRFRRRVCRESIVETTEERVRAIRRTARVESEEPFALTFTARGAPRLILRGHGNVLDGFEQPGFSETRLPPAAVRQDEDRQSIRALTDVILFELDLRLRQKAQEALLAVGTREIFPAVLWIVQSSVGHGDESTTWLIRNGDLTVVPELERLAAEGNLVADIALKGIRKRFPDQKGVEPTDWRPIDAGAFVRAAREGKSVAERVRGVRAIVTGNLRGPEARKALFDALEDPEEEVRFRATEAFTYQLRGAPIELLGRAMAKESESLRVRQMAAVALGRSGAIGAVALLRQLERPPRELQITVAGALGDTADRNLLPRLRERVEKEDSRDIRAALEEAIRRIETANRRRN